MTNLFPKWFNRLPLQIAIGLLMCGSLTVAGGWYYLTPKYSRVGYQPIQPVPFSHAGACGPIGAGLPVLSHRRRNLVVCEHPVALGLHELPQPGAAQ